MLGFPLGLPCSPEVLRSHGKYSSTACVLITGLMNIQLLCASTCLAFVLPQCAQIMLHLSPLYTCSFICKLVDQLPMIFIPLQVELYRAILRNTAPVDYRQNPVTGLLCPNWIKLRSNNSYWKQLHRGRERESERPRITFFLLNKMFFITIQIVLWNEGSFAYSLNVIPRNDSQPIKRYNSWTILSRIQIQLNDLYEI